MDRNKWLWITFFILAVCALTALAAYSSLFTYSEVCNKCGAKRVTRDFLIPLSKISVFKIHTAGSTPVGAALAKMAAIPPHEHQWLFCYGCGNGVKCAIGPGRNIEFALMSENLAYLLSACELYGERAEKEKLLAALFDPRKAQYVPYVAIGIPENGFQDAKALRQCIKSRMPDFEDTMASIGKHP